MDGSYHLSTIDEFADELLTEERVCEVILPRLTLRKVLEETEGLERRKSQLAKAMGVDDRALVASDDEDDGEAGAGQNGRKRRRSASRSGSESDRYISRSPTPETDGSKSPPRSDEDEEAGEEGRYISRSPSPDRYISRSPTPEGERIDGDI